MRRRRHNRPGKDVGHKKPNRRKKYTPQHKGLGRCSDCGDEVMFVRYEKSPFGWAPLDLRRHDDANIRVKGDYYSLVDSDTADNLRRQGVQLFKNHMIICQARGAATNPS